MVLKDFRKTDISDKLSHDNSVSLKFLIKKHYLNLLTLLLSLISVIGIAEIGLRVFFKNQLNLDICVPEMRLPYRHDKMLGWFPIKNSKRSFNASRPVTLEYNSRGFRDIEHVVDGKPGILFLGDSFVEGYDVEASERFTEKLRKKLPDWSIYNLGVTSYGTDQEYLLLKQHFDFYKPKIVFLVFCLNDRRDNMFNKNIYVCGYKPYFTIDGTNLKLNGVPVPQSENVFFTAYKFRSRSYIVRLVTKIYFKYSNPERSCNLCDPTLRIIEAIYQFVYDKGSLFMVGLQGSDLELEDFLANEHIPYVNLRNPHKYHTFGQHWTPEGHTFVSNKICKFLLKENYLKKD